MDSVTRLSVLGMNKPIETGASQVIRSLTTHELWTWETLVETYKKPPDESVFAAHERLIVRVGLYAHGLQWLQALSPDRSGRPPNSADFDRLLEWMLNRAKQEAESQSEQRAQALLKEFGAEMRVLGEIIRLGNEQEVWQLPVISDVRVERATPDPVQPHLVRAKIRAYEKVRQETLDAICRKPRPKRASEAAGRLLVLLATDQAALSLEALEASVRAIAPGIYVTGQTWHLDLHQMNSKGQDLELRRLHLDPIATAHVGASFELIQNWAQRMSDMPIKQRRKEIAKTLTRYLQKILGRREFTIKRFLEGAYQWACIHAPAVIARYARRKVESHCVPLVSHARMLGQHFGEHFDAIDPLELMIDDLEEDDAGNDKIKLKQASKSLAEVRKILGKTNDRAKARKQMIELLQDDDYPLGTPRTLFVQFLVARSERRRGVKALRLETMMLMTTLLARRWIAFAPEGQEPAHIKAIDHDTLRAWYEDMAASCTGNTSIRLITALRGFTEWLVGAEAVEPEPPRDILPGKPPVAVVSAEWLTPSDVDCVRQALRLSPEYFIDRWDREIAVCAVDLALAAGLRRSEESGIRLCDLQVHEGEITLALRPYPARRLKSLSAVRNIRLISLSEFVRAHLIRVIEREPLASTRLWSRAVADSDDERMDYSMAPAINRCMQRTLDEAGLHHHHLRHSCANHALIALMSRYLPLSDYVDQFPWLAEIIAQREMYEDMLDRRPTFRGDDLWAIAGWLGHSSPEVTLRHYLHCLDMLQYVALSRYDERETRSVLIAMGVLNKRERRRKQPGGKVALLNAITDRFPEAFVRSSRIDRAQSEFIRSGAPLYRKLEDGWLAGRECLSGDVDTRLDVQSMVGSQVDNYIARAQVVAAIPSGRRGVGLRHPMPKISHPQDIPGSAPYAWPKGIEYRSAGSIAFEFACAIAAAGEAGASKTREVLDHWQNNALAKDEFAACETMADVEIYREWLALLQVDFQLKVLERTKHRRKHYVGIRSEGRRFERAGLIWLFQMLLITQALDHLDRNGGDGSDGN